MADILEGSGKRPAAALHGDSLSISVLEDPLLASRPSVKV